MGALRAASDRQTDEDSQCCDCNENAGGPHADHPSHAVDFALRRVGIPLCHVGPELFEGTLVFGHVGPEPVQSAFILRLMCVDLFPRPRQFLGNRMDRRLTSTV